MTSLPASCRLALLAAIVSMSPCVFSMRYTHDLTIRYFTDGQLICDHPDLNVTQRTDIESFSWLLPDASLITPDSILDTKLYSLTKHVTSDGKVYRGYNLTVLEVNDDVFGYYWCLVTFTSTSPSITAIRWGLNVDGADFSELMDNYREHAIIGGIAAGVVLVLIGVVCLVWYHWCNDKLPEDVEENHLEERETKKTDLTTFQNAAFDGEKLSTQDESVIESDARL